MPRRPNGSIRRAVPDNRRGSAKQRGSAQQSDDGPAAPLGGRETHSTSEGDFRVRSIPGAGARKPYRCPGCHQEIAIGTPHLVVWPADDPSWIETAVDARRHWHTSCWHRQSTRGGPGRLR